MRLRREHKRVLMDLEILEKATEFFARRVLRVSCSGYHAWLSRVPCARKVEDQRLAVEITAVFMRSRKTYGSPRIYVDLASRGICVGRNRIARIMQILGLCAREKRSFKCEVCSWSKRWSLASFRSRITLRKRSLHRSTLRTLHATEQ